MRRSFQQLDEAIGPIKAKSPSEKWTLVVLSPDAGTEERSTWPVGIVGHEDIPDDELGAIFAQWGELAGTRVVSVT